MRARSRVLSALDLDHGRGCEGDTAFKVKTTYGTYYVCVSCKQQGHMAPYSQIEEHMIQFTNDELRALHHFLQEAIIYTEDDDGITSPAGPGWRRSGSSSPGSRPPTTAPRTGSRRSAG
jgi:hypothetical protein